MLGGKNKVSGEKARQMRDKQADMHNKEYL